MTFWDHIEHFAVDEFRCRCCGLALMDETFLTALDHIRSTVDQPLIVTSGYRCPDYNDRVAQTGRTGPHTTGRAVDLLISGSLAFKVIDLAIGYGITGIGVQQHGPHEKRYVHLDNLLGPTRPWVWSY